MKVSISLLLASTLLASTATLAQQYPVTVTDDRGAEVTIATAPERIASLSIFGADILAAFDLKEVGMITYEGEYPSYLGTGDGVTDYGDMTAPNLELMAQDEIDLTIGMVNYAGPFAEDLEKLGAFLAYDSVTLEDSYRSVESASLALGKGDEGKASNEAFRALIAEYEAKAPGDVSALFVWSYYDTLYGYQTNLLPSEFLPLLKAENVLGMGEVDDAVQAFVPLEAEDLLSLDPDYFFLFVSHGEEGKTNPAYAQMRSVKEGHAYLVGDHYSQPTGPIARELVFREIAHLLYPETFAAPELPEGSAATVLAH